MSKLGFILKEAAQGFAVMTIVGGGMFLVNYLADTYRACKLNQKFLDTSAVVSLDFIRTAQKDSLDKAYHLKLDSLRTVYTNNLDRMDSFKRVYENTGLENRLGGK